MSSESVFLMLHVCITFYRRTHKSTLTICTAVGGTNINSAHPKPAVEKNPINPEAISYDRPLMSNYLVAVCNGSRSPMLLLRCFLKCPHQPSSFASLQELSNKLFESAVLFWCLYLEGGDKLCNVTALSHSAR